MANIKSMEDGVNNRPEPSLEVKIMDFGRG